MNVADILEHYQDIIISSAESITAYITSSDQSSDDDELDLVL